MGHMDRKETYGFVPANQRAPNYFPVELVPVEAGDRTVEGWRALVCTDTGAVLHVWQDGYKLVPHAAAVAAFEGRGAQRVEHISIMDHARR